MDMVAWVTSVIIFILPVFLVYISRRKKEITEDPKRWYILVFIFMSILLLTSKVELKAIAWTIAALSHWRLYSLEKARFNSFFNQIK